MEIKIMSNMIYKSCGFHAQTAEDTQSCRYLRRQKNNTRLQLLIQSLLRTNQKSYGNHLEF